MSKKLIYHKYEKKNRTEEFFKPEEPSQSQNLYDCIKEIFPKTNSEQLENWMKETRKDEIKPEPLLFMALICGTHFQIAHTKLEDVLERLWKWLTWKQDSFMTPDLAELIIEALAPGIGDAVEKRGYERGWPSGEYVKERGRPLETRGIWVAAVVIKNYLGNFKKKSTKSKVTTEDVLKLIAILLGRGPGGIGTNEFYRNKKTMSEDTIAKLTTKLIELYDFMLGQDGVISEPQDLAPPQKDIEKYAEWKSRHRSLHYLIKHNGCERFCGLMLGRINSDLWKPLWDVKTGKLTKTGKANKLAQQ